MKKFLFVLALVLCLGLSAFALDGEGTREYPFIIETQDDLLMINDFPDCYFELANDIELEGEWEPLGVYCGGFSGTLDGKGHTISNLTIVKPYSDIGLFTENKGTIMNLKIITSDKGINIDTSSSVNIGILCGTNTGTIKQCAVIGNIKSYNENAGGICHTNYDGGNINNCRAIVNMFSDRSCAGLTILHGSGFYAPGSIINCYAVTTFSSCKNNYGLTQSNSVKNSFYDRDVSGCTDTGRGDQKSTTAMKMKLTYTKAGWDFDNVWGISKEINDGYPYLLWEYPEKEEDVLTETEAYEHDGKLVFDVSIYANAPSKITQIGLYGEGGRFIRSFMIPNFDSKKDITVVIDNEEDAVSAKIFVWENTESIKPLADCEEVQIVRNET